MPVCSNCRYKRSCGDPSRKTPCNGKVKFARSKPDKFGFMEYCVEAFFPYEFVICKNRNTAKYEVKKFKEKGKFVVVTGTTQKGNNYFIRL